MDRQNEEYKRIFNVYEDGKIENKMRLKEFINVISIHDDINKWKNKD